MSSEQDKRVKPFEEYDRISALPEHILCHILSLLPTKSAARTTVLSTTWKNIFYSSPVLDFDDSSTDFTDDHSKLMFQLSVLSVLSRRNLSPVIKFRLHCAQLPYEIETVIAWINYAICSKVQELDIDALLNGSAPLDPMLFTHKNLTNLKLCGNFVVDVPEFVFLPQLKFIHLEKLEFRDDESVRHLFSNCPVLEELGFYSCKMGNISVFNISVPSLTKLMVYDNEGVYKIVLEAAKLDEMYYSADTHVVWGGSTNSFKSLVRAVIFVDFMFNIYELTDRICDVRLFSVQVRRRQYFVI